MKQLVVARREVRALRGGTGTGVKVDCLAESAFDRALPLRLRDVASEAVWAALRMALQQVLLSLGSLGPRLQNRYPSLHRPPFAPRLHVRQARRAVVLAVVIKVLGVCAPARQDGWRAASATERHAGRGAQARTPRARHGVYAHVDGKSFCSDRA